MKNLSNEDIQDLQARSDALEQICRALSMAPVNAIPASTYDLVNKVALGLLKLVDVE